MSLLAAYLAHKCAREDPMYWSRWNFHGILQDRAQWLPRHTNRLALYAVDRQNGTFVVGIRRK